MRKIRQTYHFYFILFFLLVILISVLGSYYYNYVQDKVKREAHSSLSTLANLKVTEIVKWRYERLGDAKFIYRNVHFKNLVKDFINNSNSKAVKNEIIEWLRPFNENNEYSNISIIGNSGDYFPLFNAADSLNPVDRVLIMECLDSMEVLLSGFYKNPSSNEITLGIFIPLSIAEKKPFGVLEMRIDPNINLYPLINIIPISSPTTESFLVMQDGDSVTFLNELKFRKNSALSYKLPLSKDNLPSAMAIKGMQGIYEGVDYNGKEVLADLNNIPHSPWYIISKINLDEVYEPLREQALYIISGVLALISLCGALVFIAWRNEKLQIIRKELQAEERFSKAFSVNPNALVISRIKDGVITEVNQTFLQLFGYDKSEVIGKSSMSLNMFSDPKDRELAIALLKKDNRIRDFELKIKLRSGEERTALLSGEILEFDNGNSFLTIIQDITEKKEAEKKLEISEQQYRNLVETQQELIAKVDTEGNFLFVNEAYRRKFGVKKEDLTGKKSFQPLIYPGDLPNTLAKMKELELPPYRATIEQRAYTSEGLRWIEWNDQAVADDNGKIIEIQWIGRDIHERKEAEEALKESDEQLKKAQEIAHLGSWQLDLINNRLTWSDEVYRIFGLKPQEFAATYEGFLEAVHPEDREAVNEAYSGSIREGRDTYEIQHRIIRKTTGEIRFVHEKCEHFRDQEGKIIRSVGMVLDITTSKKAEEALRESEKRFRNLADSLPQLVWTADPDGTVDYYNSRVVEFEGISENDDGSWNWSPVLHKDDIQPTIDAWNNSVETRNNYEIIHRVKKKDGRFKWFLSRAYPIKDLNGKIIKWYGTATDVDDQKKAEKDLDRALLELKRSNKELEQFAYTASHDLQEPVRMIKSYAQILSMSFKDADKSTTIEHLNYIIEGASRMQALINDLLRYSRVSTTKKKFEPVDCKLLLEDVLKDIRLRIKEENAQIEVSELPLVKGDKTQLRQVFQNLILNAVKFRSENDPVIKIGSERKDGHWVFSIRDNGIGIDPKYHEKIFEIFQRLHHREKYPGTGIGLSICKKIIELHRGQIYIESELNEGTTFYFTIPA